ncbi:hypothetical protein [Streptomyces sp. NPDC020667]|uniref:hypothetical protein n=1 Tax=Streptomyces sp. NPDC020667 TaxID=3154895 RepID=UPI0033FE0513
MTMRKEYGPFGCVVLDPDWAQPSRAQRGGRDDRFDERVRLYLVGVAPLVIAELRNAGPGEVERLRVEAANELGSHGDDLQYGGRHQASSRTALATGFGILAYADGGVTAFGVHACTTPHEGCPGARHSAGSPAVGGDGRPI